MLTRLNTSILLNTRCRNARVVFNYTTKPAKKEKIDHSELMRDFEKVSNISQKHREKKPQRDPFVKNLLLGKFDCEILAYPELSREDVSQLEKDSKYLKNIEESLNIEQDPVKLLKTLSKEKLLGFQTSQLIGGRESTVSEQNRLSELLGQICIKNDVVANENLAIQILSKFGSDTLKKRYLRPLVSGELLSAFCVLDVTEQVHKESASLSIDGKTYTINGSKSGVLNASKADFLIVFAQTGYQHEMTAFVVEKDFGGVTTKGYDTVDSKVQIYDVNFDNTVIPLDNIIGKAGEGAKILAAIYPEFRISSGPLCMSICRRLIKNLTDYFINKSVQPLMLYETDLVREKMAKLVSSLYAIESAVYLTTGLIDTYENQDCEAEATIVQLFSTEQTLENTCSAFKILESESIVENHWCLDLHKEALAQLALGDPTDTLKLTVALMGLQHAGKEVNNYVKKIRNPFFNPADVLRRMWTSRKQQSDNPQLTLQLHEYLHPSCINSANELEYCVLRLQYATELLFVQYGGNVVNQHMELKRLADIMIDTYVMTACLGRASRSYCIGLQHAELEMYLARAFCIDAKKRVKMNVDELIYGALPPNDGNYGTIATELFRNKEYFLKHPLTRNF